MSEFDPYADGVTVPQLKARADQLGLKYTSKILKADLIAMIEIADQPTEQDELDRHVAETLPADSPDRASATPMQLEEAAEALETLRNYRAPMATRQPKTNRKGLVDGKPMGLHYRGRALGLKHHRAMGLAIGRNNAENGMSLGARTPTHKPNSERVQGYVASRNRDLYRLTPRQMRRVRKNAYKHAEHFRIEAVDNRVLRAGYSLLARTPDGMGIFHKFAEGV